MDRLSHYAPVERPCAEPRAAGPSTRSHRPLEERDLRRMGPRKFERLVADLYRQLGYEVTQTPYVRDGGKDVIARRGAEILFIECKLHQAKGSVGRRDLMVFHSAIVSGHATRGIFVTTARVTRDARTFARDLNIEILELRSLLRLLAGHGFETPLK